MKEKGRVFGQKCVASLAKYDPNTQSLKTYQCSFIEDLNEFSATLPKSGMMRNGKLSEQTMLERGIEEKGYGLWRTPDAHLGMRGAKSKEGYEDSLKNGTHAINLLDQVRHNFQPTAYPTPSRSYQRPRAPTCHVGKPRAAALARSSRRSPAPLCHGCPLPRRRLRCGRSALSSSPCCSAAVIH